jgi:hypothetical protein
VNAYHALVRATHSGTQNATVGQIEAVSPVVKSRLRVCLDLFSARRILISMPGHKIRLLKPELSREQIARSAESYRERQEQVTIRQQQMREYAEQFRFRWQRVLQYFESDELAEPCGHCDACRLGPN